MKSIQTKSERSDLILSIVLRKKAGMTGLTKKKRYIQKVRRTSDTAFHKRAFVKPIAEFLEFFPDVRTFR